MFNYLKEHDAISESAKKLANSIITKTDLNKFKHKRTKKELIDCVAIILDAAVSQYNKVESIFLIPRNSNIFSKNPLFNKYNYRTFIEAIKILENKKMIKLHKKGNIKLKKDENNKYQLAEEKGITSTYKVNDYSEWDFDISMLDKIKLIYKQEKPYEAIIRAKGTKEIIKVIKDKDVNYINKNLRKMGHPEFQYHRIFQDDTDKCGRVYNILQTVKKSERKKLYDEMDWCEVDFHAMAPNTIYMIETGEFYQGEMYNDVLEDLNIDAEYWPVYRKMIKQFFILVLNTKSRAEAKKAIKQAMCREYGTYHNLKKEYVKYFFYDNFLKKNNFDLKTKRYSFSEEQILRSFEKIHSKVKNSFFNSSYQITQKIESEIAIETMKHLIKIKEIPLSIHDCFIIKNSNKEIINKFMNKLLKNKLLKIYRVKKINKIKNKFINKYINIKYIITKNEFVEKFP